MDRIVDESQSSGYSSPNQKAMAGALPQLEKNPGKRLKPAVSAQPILSDRQLRENVIALVQRASTQLPHNSSKDDIQQVFNLQICEGDLPMDQDGAYLENERKIVINRKIKSKERRQFTLYHELVHCLIREDENIYSYLHDTYEDREIFDKTIELLCSIGSAEFIISQDYVREQINKLGFSIDLIPLLCQENDASGPAALIQLIQCAPHRCYGVVCEFGVSPIKVNPGQKALFHATPGGNLFIRYAMWSPSTKYPLSRWTLIPKEHLLAKTANARGIVKGNDRIPFRSGREWDVPCEALIFRNSVYGLFNVTHPPNPQQPRLL